MPGTLILFLLLPLVRGSYHSAKEGSEADSRDDACAFVEFDEVQHYSLTERAEYALKKAFHDDKLSKTQAGLAGALPLPLRAYIAT